MAAASRERVRCVTGVLSLCARTVTLQMWSVVMIQPVREDSDAADVVRGDDTA